MPQDWSVKWRDFAEQDQQAGDLAGELADCPPERFTEPIDTLAVAAAAALATEAVPRVLENDWSLYTPQQAAVVTATLFSQLTASARALEALTGTLDRMAQRRDLEPQVTGSPQKDSGTAAHTRLRAAATEIRELLDRHAGSCISAVDDIPSTLVLPADEHHLLEAVTPLLGESAALRAGECDAALGICRCHVEFTCASESWELVRIDEMWEIVRLDGAELGPDGGLTHSSLDRPSWVCLGVQEAAAHPRQLAETALREAAAATAVIPPQHD
ncbi:hypothetical protein [Streptomyces xiamenensis]|uniref:hypothetical protein n=1 Tax=Streptomyces xiamenensis TaxID=408015 RepID=UPI0035E25D46